MADLGTVEILTPAPLGGEITAYGLYTMRQDYGALSPALMPYPVYDAALGAYSLAGTMNCPECPECPECPPPARFSLALGATPLGLALGSADT